MSDGVCDYCSANMNGDECSNPNCGTNIFTSCEKDRRIAELEAQLRIQEEQSFGLLKPLQAEHTALVEGLRELAEKWRTGDTSYYGEGHAAADDIEALLGKESDQ